MTSIPSLGVISRIVYYWKTFKTYLWYWARIHPVLASGASLVFIVVIYYGYSALTATPAVTRYVLGTVERGILVNSLSGSGQVSAINQFDIKPKVSGDVVFVGATQGQVVKKGTLLLRIDSTDAEKAVRDAKTGLEGARVSLEKLKQPPDALTLLQTEHALMSAKEAQRNAQDDLVKAYDDGFNTVSNAFIDLPSTITGLNSILNGTNINLGQGNIYAYYDLIKSIRADAGQFLDGALSAYSTARSTYDVNLQDYKSISRYADRAAIDKLIRETYDTARSIAEAVKNVKTFLDLVNDTLTNIQGTRPPTLLATHENSLQSYIGSTNNHVSNLLNIKNTLKNDEDTILNAARTIEEKTASLTKLKNGTDPLDIRSSELSVTQRENALVDAQQKLNDYYIRAPFDGVLAKLNIKKGDPVSVNTILATVIANQQIADLSLNEVDISRVKTGQKVTLTFDAIPDFTMTGSVIQVDSIGTVTQGVVTYGVRIAFDGIDERIKSGMSVSAAIVTEVKQDVLMLQNSAIKSQGESSYVELFDNPPPTSSTDASQGIVSNTLPRKQIIQIGSANDMMTEIVSGLKEGQVIITRTIIPSATTVTAQTSSQSVGGIRIPGLTGGGGGTRALQGR